MTPRPTGEPFTAMPRKPGRAHREPSGGSTGEFIRVSTPVSDSATNPCRVLSGYSVIITIRLPAGRPGNTGRPIPIWPHAIKSGCPQWSSSCTAEQLPDHTGQGQHSGLAGSHAAAGPRDHDRAEEPRDGV